MTTHQPHTKTLDDRNEAPMSQDFYDALVETTFARREYAADTFRTMLPPALVKRLDLDALSLRSGTYVSDELRQYYTDVLYSVLLDGEQAFIYLLLKHQSATDPMFPLRLPRNVLSIWERYLIERQDATTLPVILPIVFHHEATGWSDAVGLNGSLALGADVRTALSANRRDFRRLRYLLLVLCFQFDEASRAQNLNEALGLLMRTFGVARPKRDLVASLKGWEDVIREVVATQRGREMLATVVQFILENSETDPDELKSFLEFTAGEPARTAFMTGADRLTQGVREETLRTLLARLLRQRFGKLSSDVTERLDRAHADQLEVWSERILASDTFDQVFS